MVNRSLVFLAALTAAACTGPGGLTRPLAADLIGKALAKQPPVVEVVTGDVSMVDFSYPPKLTRQAAEAFLAELQSHGFRWSSVERVFRDPQGLALPEYRLTIRGLKLPDQWRSLIVAQEGSRVLLRLGKDVRVTVTGIRRDQNEASAEFDYEWRIESGPANLASAVKDRFPFAKFITFPIGPFKGKGEATLKLYDDGWRVTRLRELGE
jgi:3'-phosphoadenosine 5'-phosphosulfate sulfotransferase (PAPS reductase)/FAD synthetase